jgi:hypothetical protein
MKEVPASEKIITKLRERRQIEAELRAMLAASSDQEFQQQAQRIVALGPEVIPTLVANLDRADARQLAVLGTVATHLDREEVTRALRQAILEPQRTDQGRIGAMSILDHYLGQPPDEHLLARLIEPENSALSSPEEVLSRAEHDPAVLIQYAEELDQQEPDLVLEVVRSLRTPGGSSPSTTQGRRAVEPLRILAQDVREEIAEAALQALAGLRLPEAAHALQTLIPISAPTLRPMAERLLRKLQFSGVEVSPLPPPNPEWRALVSPVSGRGQQSVWFVEGDQRTGHAQFLNVLLNDRAGVLQALGHTHVPLLMLPARRPEGYVHDITLPDGTGSMLMMEAAFDMGRRLVVEALVHNRETQIPVAGPMRLLSPWLWGCSGADSLPARKLPELSAEDEALLAVSDRLLEHPAFLTWSERSEAVYQAAEEILRHPGWDRGVWVRRLCGELFGSPGVAEVLSNRLVAMSEWLSLAKEDAWAKMALVTGRAAVRQAPQDLPLLLAVVHRDLERTLVELNLET